MRYVLVRRKRKANQRVFSCGASIGPTRGKLSNIVAYVLVVSPSVSRLTPWDWEGALHFTPHACANLPPPPTNTAGPLTLLDSLLAPLPSAAALAPAAEAATARGTVNRGRGSEARAAPAAERRETRAAVAAAAADGEFWW